MARQCGCFGGNENCTYCYGSGYLSKGVGDGLPISAERKNWGAGSSSPRHPLAFRSNPAPTPRVVHRPLGRWAGCPYCRETFVSDTQIEAHICAEHVGDRKDSPETARPKPLVRVGLRIFERRTLLRLEQPSRKPQNPKECKVWQDVLQKSSGVTSARPIKHQPSDPAKAFSVPRILRSEANLVQCPKCPSPVRSDRLSKHLRDKHRGETAPRTSAEIRSTMRKLAKETAVATSRDTASMTGDPSVDHTYESLTGAGHYREERRLDGSRDFAQIRDNGQFGSHPSYDDCGDDSAP